MVKALLLFILKHNDASNNSNGNIKSKEVNATCSFAYGTPISASSSYDNIICYITYYIGNRYTIRCMYFTMSDNTTFKQVDNIKCTVYYI